LEGGSSGCGVGVDGVYEHRRGARLEQRWAGVLERRLDGALGAAPVRKREGLGGNLGD
jgi:hypothetical protein